MEANKSFHLFYLLHNDEQQNYTNIFFMVKKIDGYYEIIILNSSLPNSVNFHLAICSSYFHKLFCNSIEKKYIYS